MLQHCYQFIIKNFYLRFLWQRLTHTNMKRGGIGGKKGPLTEFQTLAKRVQIRIQQNDMPQPRLERLNFSSKKLNEPVLNWFIRGITFASARHFLVGMGIQNRNVMFEDISYYTSTLMRFLNLA